jgi:polysaccharide export outer membrane protein
MKKYLSAILALVFCFGGVAAAQDTSSVIKTNAAVSQDTEKRGYLLGVGDEIELKVLGEPQFDGAYTVDEDGKIELPFVETPVTAMCRTDRELRLEIIDLLKKYLREPQVNVRITEKRSRPPATVYGEVRNPQQFDMRRSVRLLELLSYTGGFTEQASGLVQVFHTKPVVCAEPGAKVEPVAIDEGFNVPSETYRLSDLRAGKTEANPVVRPGDVIVVLKSMPVYIVGEVRQPQGVYIPERGLTVTDAVAMVGGLNERAKKKDIRIYRLKQGSSEREMISANLDSIKKGQQENMLLQPYDIVEVEKAPKSFGQILSEFAIGAVRTASGALPTSILY